MKLFSCVLSLLFTLNLSIPVSVGQTHEDAQNLTNILFSTYDFRIRPNRDQSQPTEVLVDFVLLTINDLDEVSETMKVTGYLIVSWVDEYLAWTPGDYGGLDYYLWPQMTVWKPDVSLRNSIVEYKELGVMTLNVEVQSDGTVTWQPFEVFRSTCSFDITYFPFDVQTCSLDFIAWSYTKSEVTMKGGSKGIDLGDYTPSSTWHLLDTSWSIQEENGESAIKYSFTAKRKPLFFIQSIIMPIILLAFLNLFVFALPCESGERAGFSVTVFLALAVFLTIVSDNLPKNSERVSVFAIYMVILTVQSTIITIVAMITIRWSSNNENQPIPGYMITIAHIVKSGRNGKVADRGQADTINTSVDKGAGIRKDDFTNEDVKTGYTNTQVDGILVVGESPSMDASSLEERKQAYTWVEIVRVLDILCFIVFFIIFFISTVVCFVVCSAASR